MSETCSEGSSPVAGRAVEFLSFVAAPTFALMAVLTGAFDVGPPDMLCSATSPLNGMVVMYLLMSVFHSGPWLRQVSGRPSRR